MPPFQPAGNQARWKTVYELLRAAPQGRIVTYAQIGDALGLDPASDRHRISGAVRRAAKEHEEKDKRAIDVVANIGYRITVIGERAELAIRHQKRAGRSLARGHSKATNVDLNGAEPEVRHALELLGRAFTMQMDFNRRFTVRQEKLEQTIRDIADTQVTDRKRTDEEIDELKERLKRLEGGEPETAQRS